MAWIYNLIMDSIKNLDRSYLERVLNADPQKPGLAVEDFSIQPVRGGLSGALFYSVIVQCVGHGRPYHLLLKMNGGENEIRFYQNLASLLPIETPRVLDAHVDDDHRALLLMEKDENIRDNLTWTEEDYRQVVTDMARFHAPFWAKTETLADHSWLCRPYTNYTQKEVDKLQNDLAAIRASWLPQALPGLFGPERLSTIGQVLDRSRELFEPLTATGLTFVQGDYWFHNVLLTTGGRRVLVDWGGCHIESGFWELVYFINLLLAIAPGEYRAVSPVDPARLEG